MEVGPASWQLARRFRDFCDLRACLRPFKSLAKLPFPGKSFMAAAPAELETRKRMLNAYLEQLTIRQALPSVVQRKLVDFLELHRSRQPNLI